MSVIDNPRIYNTFTLDGDVCPGLAVITSGGERKIEIVDQGQLLTRGKNTVVRSIENIVVSYGFKLWLPEHIAKRDKWIAMLEEGARRVQPRVYKLVDLNMPWLTRVCLQGFKPQTPLAPGGPWDWQLVLHEYNRVKPFGGPLKPPVTGNAIAEATAARDRAQNALAKAVEFGNARRAAGK